MLLGFTSLAHAVGGWAARRLGWDAPRPSGVAVLGLALIVLPTFLSRLVGVAPDALRAGAFALLARRAPSSSTSPGRSASAPRR